MGPREGNNRDKPTWQGRGQCLFSSLCSGVTGFTATIDSTNPTDETNGFYELAPYHTGNSSVVYRKASTKKEKGYEEKGYEGDKITDYFFDLKEGKFSTVD